jgi:aminopeptidase-like protein
MHLKNKVKAGFVMTCCGMDRPFVYKQTKQKVSLCDRLVAHILEFSGYPYVIQRFEPFGSDERQYCSPGFNLPVGSLMRAKYHDYEEYHTSLDNKTIFSFRALAETIDMYFSFVKAFELNRSYKNTIMYGEPMLGKRGLYADFSLKDTVDEAMKKRLRLINYMDGNQDLLSFCETYDYSIFDTEHEIQQLINKGVLK